MAKFDLKGLLNDRSVPDRQQDQKIVYRNPKDLIPSEENFYNTEKLERLKQSIKLLGILQPLLIENRDGKDYVIAGHCRRKCCIDLLNEGNDRFSRVPCIYKTHSELEQDAGKEDDIVRQIMIIQANCYRDKSDWEKMTETLKMEELVKELREKTPMEGKTRDILKDLIGTSNGQLGRYHAINTNLCEQLMSEFEEDRIKISVAYEASKLNREYQKQACELYEETGILTLDDIRDLYRQQEAEKGIPGQMTIETATGQNRPPEDDTEIPAETQIERFYESTNKNMKNYIIQEDKKGYLAIADEKLPAKTILKHQLIAGGLRIIKNLVEDCQEEPEQPEQPPLPEMRNNDQRKQWLREYKSWGLWYTDHHTGTRYYKYDFNNGARLIAEEYDPEPRKESWWTPTESYSLHLVGGPEPERSGGVPKWTYHSKYHKFPNSETELVEFLKEVQKNGKA